MSTVPKKVLLNLVSCRDEGGQGGQWCRCRLTNTALENTGSLSRTHSISLYRSILRIAGRLKLESPVRVIVSSRSSTGSCLDSPSSHGLGHPAI
jgi:hypothetical protein